MPSLRSARTAWERVGSAQPSRPIAALSRSFLRQSTWPEAPRPGYHRRQPTRSTFDANDTHRRLTTLKISFRALSSPSAHKVARPNSSASVVSWSVFHPSRRPGYPQRQAEFPAHRSEGSKTRYQIHWRIQARAHHQVRTEDRPARSVLLAPVRRAFAIK
jgi:hypothetical protein